MREIDGKNSASIYVVDDSYRLIYFNQVLQKVYPKLQVGDFCYRELCQESEPCRVCPLRQNQNREMMFYNKVQNSWINVVSGELVWPQKGRGHIVLARRMSEEHPLFESLKQITTYEEFYALQERQRQNDSRIHNVDVDPLTGLYRKVPFFLRGEELLKQSAEGRYCLVAIDIEHFKLFNAWYGQAAGDKLLKDIADLLQSVQRQQKGLAGYIGEDDFVLLLRDDEHEIRRIQEQIKEYVREYGENAGFLPAFGVYHIEERESSVRAMYDLAVIAMNSVKGNYANRIGYYDRRMKQRLEADQLLLSEVQRGMENGEFVFYVQPKCDLKTGKIVGLESLVRWNHPKRGVLTPGLFLPQLESNGLITNLDIYIWERVCQVVRRWIDRGKRAIPISVNVSNVDIIAVDVARILKDLVKQYDLDPQLIEVEITESSYVKDFDKVIVMVNALHEAGFTVLMDDFGSGYSSLNMLKDISVDILKIDMKFLDLNEHSHGKGIGILEAVARMARVMGLRMIAEGVERQEQVDFLLEIGCGYGQGYFFYHPLMLDELEELIGAESNVDFRGIVIQQMEEIRIQDIFNQNVISTLQANNILGATAFYDIYDGKVELARVNEKYYVVTKTAMVDLEEKRRDILTEIHPEDRMQAWNLFEKARNRQLDGAEGVLRRMTGDRTWLWIHVRIFYLREQNGHSLFCGILDDISWQVQHAEGLQDYGDPADRMPGRVQLVPAKQCQDEVYAMQLLKKYAPDCVRICRWVDNRVSFQTLLNGLFRKYGYEQFAQDQDISRFMRESDRTRVKDMLFLPPEPEEEYHDVVCFQLPGGEIVWAHLYAHRLADHEEGRTYLCIYTDITAMQGKDLELGVARQQLESVLRLAGVNSWQWDIKHGTLMITDMAMLFEVFKNPTFYRRGDWLCVDRFPEVVFEQNYVTASHQQFIYEFLERVKEALPGKSTQVEFPLSLPAGRVVWLTVNCETIRDEMGLPVKAVGYYRDIDTEKREVRRLTKRAETDAMSGLYNRQTGIARIQAYLEENRDHSSALIMIDLDKFKRANDMFGHQFGDELIEITAKTIRKSFRRDDVICRFGGDEFLVLCKNILEQDLIQKMEEIIRNLNMEKLVDGKLVTFTASAGYVMIPEQGTEYQDLFQKADMALFDAKLRGRGRWCRYREDMKPVRVEGLDEAGEI